METVAGIKEEELSSLAMDILDYSERISRIFDKIDLALEGLPQVYKSATSNEIFSKYQEFRKNYPIIISNINSYSDDISALIVNMKLNSEYLSKLIIGYTNEKKSETKKIS